MGKLKKYLLLFLYLISAITYVRCDGQIAVIEKPSSMRYNGGNEMRLSDLMESVEHMLGYQFEGAKQMEVMNVFDLEKINLMLMLVDSTYDINSGGAVKTYQMKADMSPEDMLNELKKTTARGNSFGKTVSIEPITSETLIDLKNESPRLFWADMRSMPDAKVTETINSWKKLTEGLPNVLKIILSSDGITSISYDRERRDAAETTDESNNATKDVVNANTLNLADDYDENFPVIFNIILWFSVALIFALIAICMVIANMDPGRDSIIYRMTSTRMKKDN